MMNSSIKSFSLLAVILLAGCSSPTSRIADCRAQGVSHDTCYLAEQQRQTAILSASEAQAFKMQKPHNMPAAKKAIYKGFGMTFRMSSKTLLISMIHYVQLMKTIKMPLFISQVCITSLFIITQEKSP